MPDFETVRGFRGTLWAPDERRMSDAPITGAIEQTVSRLLSAEKEAQAMRVQLESVGVTLRRTPQGCFWSLPSVGGVVANESTPPI